MKKLYKIPSEPQFDAYLRNRGIDPGQYRLHKQGLAIPKQPVQRLDILRLSYNVKRNMGTGNDYDKFDKNETNDVELKGDVELDFDDEKVQEEMKEERVSLNKNYELEPTTSKTVAIGSKAPPV